MKTKHLKGYRLLVDAFGDMPIWSLQHAKGSGAFYMIKLVEYTIPKEHDIINELDRLAIICNDMWFDVRITCDIEYDHNFIDMDGKVIKIPEYNIVHKIKILKIEIENDKEAGQP